MDKPKQLGEVWPEEPAPGAAAPRFPGARGPTTSDRCARRWSAIPAFSGRREAGEDLADLVRVFTGGAAHAPDHASGAPSHYRVAQGQW